MRRVFVSGAFDDPRSPQLRFLQEAAKLGPLTLLLWPDAERADAGGLGMGLAERMYYFEALRYIDKVEAAPPGLDPDRLPAAHRGEAAIWALSPAIGGKAGELNDAKLSWCRSRGIDLREIPESALGGFPYEAPAIGPKAPGTRRVVATGCYDWLHTGHLRFFEEAAAFGELNVVIGSDANVRLLKGEGHPLFPEAERRYLVGSFRPVARCLISTGTGWLDAEPEIRELDADRYVVNEDGDKPEKRRYCEENGIEYIVLSRSPREGLPRRSSTELRGY